MLYLTHDDGLDTRDPVLSLMSRCSNIILLNYLMLYLSAGLFVRPPRLLTRSTRVVFSFVSWVVAGFGFVVFGLCVTLIY
jgi:hypothetical protein